MSILRLLDDLHPICHTIMPPGSLACSIIMMSCLMLWHTSRIV